MNTFIIIVYINLYRQFADPIFNGNSIVAQVKICGHQRIRSVGVGSSSSCRGRRRV
jgi:hypothetical protein